MIGVDVWADVRCPWCWIGLRRLQRARAALPEQVRVRRRSFLLEPEGPVSPGRATAHVARSEWGMTAEQWESTSRHIRSVGRAEGVQINLDGAVMFDSRRIHRLLKLAAATESVDTDAAWDSAFAAHFGHNRNLGDAETLRELVTSWSVDGVELEHALTGASFADEVTGDHEEARRLAISSVPTVVAADGRRLSGMAPLEELTDFLMAAGAVS